ncbi:ATP synthase membrane subunit c locus 3a isoform X3 [Onychostoma macrolepis]|uniref:ATP synthase membrane subunit c locus 3a isoform X3 n=1 Tax=Onychostoma macrolepis TaxID=369639 RepID=UPI002729F28A|nr:ATP synthase membrane subunit c locus 3a isoform X3 [Onychostoma macrolepis]
MTGFVLQAKVTIMAIIHYYYIGVFMIKSKLVRISVALRIVSELFQIKLDSSDLALTSRQYPGLRAVSLVRRRSSRPLPSKSQAAQNHSPLKMFTCAKFVSTPALGQPSGVVFIKGTVEVSSPL